jgi:hypothetical protein
MSALVAFALRRALPPWLAVFGVLALAGVAWAASGGGNAPSPLDARAAARALARENAWSVLLALAPLFLWHAARLGTPQVRGWLAPTPPGALALTLPLALGVALAGALATALTALVGEGAARLAAPAPAQAWRRVEALPCPEVVLHDDAPRARWRVPALEEGVELRLALRLALGAGPSAAARLTARTVVGPERASALEAHISGATHLALAPPAAGVPLELELERVSPGALLVVGGGALEALAPAAEGTTAPALALRAGLALAAGGTLALGLASRLGPALAAALVLALGLASLRTSWGGRWLPGADLPRVARELAQGLVPAALPAGPWLGAGLAAALGLALAARGLRAGGRAS